MDNPENSFFDRKNNKFSFYFYYKMNTKDKKICDIPNAKDMIRDIFFKKISEQLPKNCKTKYKITLKNVKLAKNLFRFMMFLKSDLWMSLKESKIGHDICYDCAKKIFGLNKILFADNGKITNDDYKLSSQLTQCEFKEINRIDHDKIAFPSVVGNYAVMYIGSVSCVQFDAADTTTTDNIEDALNQLSSLLDKEGTDDNSMFRIIDESGIKVFIELLLIFIFVLVSVADGSA